MRSFEIYGRDNCSYCRDAVSLLTKLNLPFAYRDITVQLDKAELMRRAPGVRTVPQIFVGDRHIGGFDDLAKHTPHELQQMIGE